MEIFKTSGTQLHLLNAAGTAYERTFKNVTSISFPEMTVEEIDVTTLDSAATETAPGNISFSEVQVSANLNVEDILAIGNLGVAERQFAITFPPGKGLEALDVVVRGYISASSKDAAEPNGTFKYSFTIKVIGKPLPFTRFIGPLRFTVSAGSNSGNVKVKCEKEPFDGDKFVYKVGTSLTTPTYNTVLTTGTGGYTVWDGFSEIAATTGDDICVVEVDADNKALLAGLGEV